MVYKVPHLFTAMHSVSNVFSVCACTRALGVHATGDNFNELVLSSHFTCAPGIELEWQACVSNTLIGSKVTMNARGHHRHSLPVMNH